MKKVLLITLSALLVVVVAVSIFYAYVHFSVEDRLAKVYSFPPEAYSVFSDSISLAKGAHVSMTRGCPECHGKDMGGKAVIDDPVFGVIYASNLTKGEGGVGSEYKDHDWIMALRHGIGRDGRPLLLMPSHETTKLSEEDLTALIAYCKSLSPVDKKPAQSYFGPIGRALTFFDQIEFLSVETIDHNLKPVSSISKNAVDDFGKYLSVTCTGCHGANFKGGKAHIPGSPDVSDITQTGNIRQWTEEQFRQVLRTGQTPEGKKMKNEFMPWEMTKAYSDEEIHALYTFLKTQP